MEEKYLCLISEIIEMIDTKTFDSLLYDGNKFHIIDTKRKIDLEAKFGENNFYLKDNIGNFLYMYSKEYIDNLTSIRQVLFDDGFDKNYISFFKRYNDLGIIRVAKKISDVEIICSNYEILGKGKENLLEYIDKYVEEEEIVQQEIEQQLQEDDIDYLEEDLEFFNSINNDNISTELWGKENTGAEKRNIDYGDSIITDEYNDDSNNSEFIDEDEKYDENSEMEEVDLEEDFSEETEEEFKVIRNGTEVNGSEKYSIIAMCAEDVSDAYWGSMIMEMGIENLKNALRYLNKDIELEK